MKKILCLIDFSQTSLDAAAHAAALARKTGAQLSLLHTVHLPIANTSETALMAGELLGEQIQDAEEKLHEVCRRLSERFADNHSGVPQFNCVVREALLTDAVDQMTAEDGYDLVVMGTTGGSNSLEEMLIGSSTQSVIGQVKCPVLAIPEGASQNEVRKIIYAADFHEHDLVALREVGRIAALLGARLDVVHITKKNDGKSTAAAAEFNRQLKAIFPGETVNFEEFIHEDKEKGLQEYVLAREGDMLAMLKKEGGFFSGLFRQNLADRMTSHTRLPLLVVHGLDAHS